MNKKELIRTISRELDSPMSQEKISLVLDKAVEITKRALASGESVKWSGFGSFVMKDVPPRFFYSIHLEKYTISKGAKRITFVPFRSK